MEDKNFDKKKLIIIGVVVIVIIVAVVIFIPKSEGKLSQKEELTSKLEQLGAAFYEDFYYPQLGATDEERADFVKDYASVGVKVDLDNLERYDKKNNEKIVAEFVNEETGKECDKYNTKAIIFPEEPYTKDSYRIEVQFDCGFDGEEQDNEGDKEQDETKEDNKDAEKQDDKEEK